jgi:2-polyprenyl-3-methyl-5-hydroxy-6-metoxy-1,4-benzoquinol methylase
MNNNISRLEEEIFCLKTELDTLAGVILRFESERWVPGYLFPQTENSHIARYELACKYSNGRKVLDVACGSGKGSSLISEKGNASFVLGCDISQDTIRYATHRYKSTYLDFTTLNAQDLPFENEFDLVVSFETIEHLPDYSAFLRSVRKSLKKGGLFLISTPISSIGIDNFPENPYHVREWGFKQFQEILSEYFLVKNIFVQLYPNARVGYESLAPTTKWSTLKKFFYGKTPDVKVIHKNISVIEEFFGQYSEQQLCTKNSGYQICLLQKDE